MALLGEGRQLDHAGLGGGRGVGQVLAFLTRLLELFDLGVGRGLHGFGLKLLKDGGAGGFQRHGLAGLDRGDLGDREAQTALDRRRHLIGGQGEDGGADGGVAHGGLRRGLVVAQLNVVGLGCFGGVLTGAQVGGDLVGGFLGRDRQSDEGALLRLGQRGLAELITLLDLLFGDRRARVVRAGREQDQRDHAEFGAAQTRLVFLHEGGQLGVGRRSGAARHGLSDREPAAVARLQRLARQQGGVDARRLQTGEDGRADVGGDILVAQVVFQHFRRQILLGQGLGVQVFVELARDLVEEGGNLADLSQDQFLARTDAGLIGPVQEAQSLGLAVEILLVQVLLDHVVIADGTTGLLLKIGADALEVGAELVGIDAAVPGADDVARPQIGEDVGLRPDDQEAEDDQGEQACGPFRLGEVSEVRDHRKEPDEGRRRKGAKGRV